MTQEKQEFLFKILIIGDVGCGKTSLVKRFVHDIYSDHTQPTIGVDFLLKVIEQENRVIRLQIWDVSGQERLGNMTRVYYRDAVAALILTDITRPTTLDGAKKWKQDLDDKLEIDGEPVPTLLVCNKIDLVSQSYRDEVKNKLETYISTEKINGYLMTSVKNNENIDSAFEFIIKEIMGLKSNLLLGEEQAKKGINLGTGVKKDPDTCYC
jgi:Ras-related protein Rab-32